MPRPFASRSQQRSPQRRSARPLVLPAALAAAALALGGCSVGGPSGADATMPPSAGSAASAVVTDAPLEAASGTATVPVYWLGHSGTNIFLYREFLSPRGDSDPIHAALDIMTSQRPLDPDYFTPWKQPSKLGVSISGTNLITVDISSDAFSDNVDAGIAERAISELVYTATGAAAAAGLIAPSQNIQVSILVDGHTDYMAFGKVPLDKPFTRDTRFLAPVWIIAPQNDAQSGSGSVQISGRGISSSGLLKWQLLHVTPGSTPGTSTDSAIVSTGQTAIAGGAEQLGSFGFTLRLPAGSYELRVFSTSPAAPGQQLGVDSKDFTLK